MMIWAMMMVLTVVSTIGLLIKLWRSGMAPEFKWLLSLAVIFPLAFCLVEFRTMAYGYPFVSTYCLIRYSAYFIIALNWSINLAKKLSQWDSAIVPQLSIPFLTIGLLFLIHLSLRPVGKLGDDCVFT